MNSLDDRFMEVLLRETYCPSDVEDILKRVMSTVETPSISPAEISAYSVPAATTRRQWTSAIFSLVTVVIVISILAMWPHESSATEILKKVVAEVEMPISREYLVEVQGRLQLQAVLWVQGGDRFVIRMPSLVPAANPYLWIGCNGKEFWIIPAVGPVLVDRRPDWLLQYLHHQMKIPLPFLHVSSVTRRLNSRYNPPDLLIDESGIQRVIIDKKSSSPVVLPDRVEIDAQHHIIRKMELRWTSIQSGEKANQMSFTLQSSSTISADWFEHAAHHAATRRVVSAQENVTP